MTSPFVPLHVHGAHSQLDGLAWSRQMAAAAVADGQPACALTDHGTLEGTWEHRTAMRAAGIKPIVGEEIYLALGSRFDPRTDRVPAEDDFDGTGAGSGGTKEKRYEHLTVLAATPAGWRNLVGGHNESWSTFRYKPLWDWDLLAAHAGGLIVGSGCLGGPVAGPLLRDDMDTARANLGRLVDIFGPDGVFVEVMDHGIAAERKVIPGLVALAADLGLPVVATNDSHYAGSDDADIHDAWLAIGSSKGEKVKLVSDPDRFRFNGSGYHLRTATEMHALFDDQPGTADAVANSVMVAERVTDEVMPVIPDGTYRLPKFPLPDGYTDSATLFHDVVRAGALQRSGADGRLPEQMRQDLRWEEDVIVGAGMQDYMLMTKDFIDHARSVGIACGPGRGSGPGSRALYAMGVTQPDPIANELRFDRFLDPARVGMPDVDMDFQASRQHDMFDYAVLRYGADRVARIGAPGMAWAKDAVKKMGRVLDRTPLANEIAATIPDGVAKDLTLAKLMQSDNVAGAALRGLVDADPDAADLVDRTMRIEGVPASQGLHACGVIIGDEALTDLIPMRRDTSKDSPETLPITEWSAPELESFGLVKFDFLALKDLDVTAQALRLIEEGTGEKLDLWELEPAKVAGSARDENTAAMIAAGGTQGVFQLASGGMTELARNLRPRLLDDYSALVALYRPGPMGAGMHDRYARRRRGTEPIDYGYLTSSPAEQKVLGSVLDRTMGVLCIAQGQRVWSVTRAEWVCIEDIKVGEKVQSVGDGGRHVASEVSRVIDNGTRDTVTVTFADGSKLTCTADHRLLTTDGWVEAGRLTGDCSVAAPLALLGDPRQAPDVDCLADEAALIGYLIADGGLTRGTDVLFYKRDEALHAEIARLTHALFADVRAYRVKDGPRGVHRTRLSSATRVGYGGRRPGGLLRLLRDTGLKDDDYRVAGPRSRDKFIPARYLQAGPDVLQRMLAALWDGDGHVGDAYLTYRTVSERLAQDVRTALLRLGIVSTVSRGSHRTATGSGDDFVVVVGQVNEFARCIGPWMRAPAKRDALNRAASANSGRRKGQWSRVPTSSLLHIKASVGPWKPFCAGAGISDTVLRSKFVGADMLAALANASGDQTLSALVASRWVQVRSVEPARATRVFDLSVEDNRNFVVEGVVAHNCYQEQLMALGEVVAGMGPGDVNKLRKAVSKKRADDLAAMKTRWMDGGHSDVDHQGRPKVVFATSTLEELWRTFQASAAYAFNKSHSCAYGLLGYQTAYLKANWPVEYGAALLACTDATKAKAEKRQAMMTSLHTDGIAVVPPDVNSGALATSVTADRTAVILGLAEVAGVKSNAAWIITERERGGPFTSLHDLMSRVRTPDDAGQLARRLPVNVVEALVESGALDGLGPRLGLLMVARACAGEDVPVPDAEWGLLERSARQRQRLGVAVGEHPVAALSTQVREWTSGQGLPPRPLHRIEPIHHSRVVVAGVIAALEERKGSTGTRARIVLEGSRSHLEVMAWPRMWQQLKGSGAAPRVGDIVGVAGRLQVVVPMCEAAGADDTESVVDEPEVSVSLYADEIFTGPLSDPVTACGPAPGAVLTLVRPDSLRGVIEPVEPAVAVVASTEAPAQGDEADEQPSPQPHAPRSVPDEPAVIELHPPFAGEGLELSEALDGVWRRMQSVWPGLVKLNEWFATAVDGQVSPDLASAVPGVPPLRVVVDTVGIPNTGAVAARFARQAA